jgi:hypothetical protein
MEHTQDLKSSVSAVQGNDPFRSVPGGGFHVKPRRSLHGTSKSDHRLSVCAFRGTFGASGDAVSNSGLIPGTACPTRGLPLSSAGRAVLVDAPDSKAPCTGVFDNPGADGIEVHVSRNVPEVGLVFQQRGAVAPLKEMLGEAVAAGPRLGTTG